MPISAALIEVAVKMSLQGKPALNRCFHTWDGAAVAAATPEAIGEAFWNDVKVRLRAITPAAEAQVFFTEVFVREVGGGNVYGSYAIPSGERGGTRTVGSSNQIMPNFVAGAVKMTVGSSTTKPGSKRQAPLLDADVLDGNLLSSEYLALLDDFAEAWCSEHVLGAPVATGVLFPVIVRFNGAGEPTANQPVTGWLLKARASSQLTRKLKP